MADGDQETIHDNPEPAAEPGSDEVAVDVGGAALSDATKAEYMENDSNPLHPRGNAELAHEMANAQLAGEQMIDNIQKSNAPNKDELIKTIRERGAELAEAAKDRYLVEREMYQKVFDFAMGQLLFAGEAKPQPYTLLFEIVPTLEANGSKYKEGFSNTVLTAAQVDRLVADIYAACGADAPRKTLALEGMPPDTWDNLEMDKSGFRSLETPTNLGNGTSIIEQHHTKDDRERPYEQIRFAVVTKAYMAENGVTPSQLAA